MANIAYKPEWAKYEKGIRVGTSEEQLDSADAFDETRAKEMIVSKQARDYETSRKASLAKDKPQWIKQQREKNKAPDSFGKLKQLGSFDMGLTPAPGYLVVATEDMEQKTTESGIILNTMQDIDDSGVVLVNGADLPASNNFATPCWWKVGDKILYKRGAGVDMKLKDKKCKLMLFSDVLGVFDD